jgi:hypothetical protein
LGIALPDSTKFPHPSQKYERVIKRVLLDLFLAESRHESRLLLGGSGCELVFVFGGDRGIVHPVVATSEADCDSTKGAENQRGEHEPEA